MKVGYKEIKKAVNHIVLDLDFTPQVLVLLGCGGLVGGYFLAKQLNIKSVVVLNFSSYDGQNRGRLKEYNQYIKKHQLNKLNNVLIFDDLVDSGYTMKHALKILPRAKSATLFYKSKSIITPDYYYKECSNKERVEFCYENIF